MACVLTKGSWFKRVATGCGACLLALSLCLSLPNCAIAGAHCSDPTGLTPTDELISHYDSAMQGHVAYITCISSALRAGNFGNASNIARTKLGLNTTGGMRSYSYGFYEPSQKLWEKGYAFRKQATQFAYSASAAKNVPSSKNQMRAYEEFLGLLDMCQSCHETLR